MYNGIGLATVRGSGTNGYVTKNMSHVSRSRIAERKETNKPSDFAMKEPRAPNLEIIEHNRKREVELKVMRLRDNLEEEGVVPSVIEEKVAALRTSLLAKLPPPSAGGAGGAGAARPGETHSDAANKQSENEALKSALGIGNGYVGGSAFDRELQERQKAERMAKRAAEEEEVAAMEAALEREKEREEKKRRREARALEKEEKKKAKRSAH